MTLLDGPAVPQLIMQHQFLSAMLAVSSSCEALHIICDSYIDKSLKDGERVRRSSNIASEELSIPDESIVKCWV